MVDLIYALDKVTIMQKIHFYFQKEQSLSQRSIHSKRPEKVKVHLLKMHDVRKVNNQYVLVNVLEFWWFGVKVKWATSPLHVNALKLSNPRANVANFPFLNKGVLSYLTKPFVMVDLIYALDKVTIMQKIHFYFQKEQSLSQRSIHSKRPEKVKVHLLKMHDVRKVNNQYVLVNVLEFWWFGVKVKW